MSSVRRRRRDFAILRALGFTSWQVRGTLCWQALTLAGIALLIGVPAGIACGRLCWQVFAHQLGITPVVAVPLAVLAVMAAGWLAAAAVIAALPSEAATRNPRPRCCTANSAHTWRLFAAQLGVLPEPAIPLTAILIAIPSALALANLIAAAPRGQRRARGPPPSSGPSKKGRAHGTA